jgi:hypothetical protein
MFMVRSLLQFLSNLAVITPLRTLSPEDNEMARRKWLKRTLWGFAILVLAIGLMLAIMIWEAARYRAVLIIENETVTPVEVVSLNYGGKKLLEDPAFKSLSVFPDLHTYERETEILLLLKRPGEKEAETHSFIAYQGPYVEDCAFQISIREEEVQMRDCFSLQ